MAKKKIVPIKWKKKDPFRVREIKNYGKDPLPSREFIISCIEKKKVSNNFYEIAKCFSLSKSQQDFFMRRIKAMLRDEELFIRNDKLSVNKNLNSPINILLTEKKKKQFSITKALRTQFFNEEIIEKYNLPHKFSAELEKLKFPKNPKKEDVANREDWTKYAFVTIDGEDSRDFDDAVYCTKRADNYRLFVAIADVSHYVKKDSLLDIEAQNRGTSVYFPDRVIPMLPEILSNGLCSLNPDCERLVLGVIMNIDGKTGEIKKAKFAEAVINSKARLTYNEVELMLFKEDKEKSAKLRKKYKKVLSSLENLKAVFSILKKARIKRNAIEFTFPEAKAIFDSKGNIKTITASQTLNAHQLIEECMVAANIKAAQFVAEHQIPALYRVHSTPPDKKLERLIPFLSKLGLKGLKLPKNNEDWTAEKCNQIIELARSKEERELLELMVLRSLAPALYEPVNAGHFALALKDYAHFTSPIRRYPDLLLHRAIKFILHNGKKEDYFYNLEQMQNLGISCSETEKRAEESSRKAMDFLKCEFIANYLGEVFEGKVSAVVKFGLFVSLDKFYIDGLVHIKTLSDYFIFNPDNQTLTGDYSGEVFKIGDRVQIRVAAVNINECKIDFELYQHYKKKKRKK